MARGKKKAAAQQAEPAKKPAAIAHAASVDRPGRTVCGLPVDALLPDHAVETNPDPLRACLTCESLRHHGMAR